MASTSANLISVKDLYLLQANLSWSFPAWIPPAGARCDRKWNPKIEGIKNIKLQVQTNKQNIKSLSENSFPTPPKKIKKHVNNWKIKHDNVCSSPRKYGPWTMIPPVVSSWYPLQNHPSDCVTAEEISSYCSYGEGTAPPISKKAIKEPKKRRFWFNQERGSVFRPASYRGSIVVYIIIL